MFLNDSGYAEMIGVAPEAVHAERQRGLRIEAEVKKTIGVLKSPFRRCAAMTNCVAEGGSYIETHPDISAFEMGEFQKHAQDAYEQRRRRAIMVIMNRTAEIIPFVR